MKFGSRLFLLTVVALALASCAASYDGTYANAGPRYHGSYADYPYAGSSYPRAYGGIVPGKGWHNHWNG